MKKVLFLFLILTGAFVSGCTEEFDDTSILNSIKSLEKRMDAMDAVLSAYKNSLFITDVKEVTDGYVITFSDGSTASVYHGKDGEDGKDGKDGEDGKDGKDGADGADGEDGADGADGVGGDPLIESIEIGDDGILFILTDGASFTIPYFASLDIVFDEDDLGKLEGLSTRDIDYVVESQIKTVSVEVFSSADIKARVIPDAEDPLAGVIRIQTSAVLDAYSNVVVLATNGEKMVMKSLDFEVDQITISDNAVKDVAIEGAEVSLEFLTNVEYQVQIPSAAQSWITVIPDTKALEAHVVKLKVWPNEGAARTANVVIRSVAGNQSASYTIKQSGLDPDEVRSFKLVYIVEEPGETDLVNGSLGVYSDPYDANTKITRVDFGDGTSEEADRLYSHFYESAGEYTVTVSYKGFPTYFKNFGGPSDRTVLGCAHGDWGWHVPLKKIEFPASINDFDCLGNEAPHLVEVSFLGNVPETNVFKYCENLSRFTGKYATEDGSVLIKDGVLIAMARAGYEEEEYVVPEGVTAIAEYAFYGVPLKKIKLPSTLEVIGNYAFAGSSLEEIMIPESVIEMGRSLFSGCDNLRKAEVAAPMIPDNLFSGCKMLSEVTLKQGVMQIGEAAFDGCTSLKSIDIPASVSVIGISSFRKTGLETILIGKGVTFLGNYSFESCTALTEVNFEEGINLVSIQEYAFKNCSSLRKITVPKSVKNIFEDAFSGCENLSEVTFEEGSQLTYMAESIFEKTAVEKIELPSTLKAIPDYAFYGSALSEITLNEGLITIGIQAFAGCFLTEIRIPDSVVSIAGGAFQTCYGEEGLSVYLGSGLEDIDASALYHCSGLRYISSESPYYITTDDNMMLIDVSEGSVMAYASYSDKTEYEVPSSVDGVTIKKIGVHAFRNSVITKITLPATIEHLDLLCLQNGCMEEVYFKGTVPPTMTKTSNSYEDGGFGMVGSSGHPPIASSVTVYVPSEAVEAYTAAGYRNVTGY